MGSADSGLIPQTENYFSATPWTPSFQTARPFLPTLSATTHKGLLLRLHQEQQTHRHTQPKSTQKEPLQIMTTARGNSASRNSLYTRTTRAETFMIHDCVHLCASVLMTSRAVIGSLTSPVMTIMMAVK